MATNIPNDPENRRSGNLSGAKPNTYPLPAMGIKTWAEEDRPREKLLLKGKASLSDAELLAILLGSGTRELSAVDLAKHMLQSVDNNLHELGKRSVAEWMKFKGVGEAKSVTIAAAMELGRRRQLSSIREKPQVRCSLDAYKVIAPLLADLPHEEFWLLLLNRANRVIAREQISLGGLTGTVADAKIIFRRAIEGGACALILCHNHPSGNTRPSTADIDLTKKLSAAGELIDLPIVDHLIIGEADYYSFADEGAL